MPDRDHAGNAAFAAAMAALLVTTFVVNRSSGALESTGTVATNSIASGTIALTDDDLGRSLFDLEAMAPGRPEVQCLEVTYTGTILPVILSLSADTGGDLAPYLGVRIEVGTGALFGSCDGFRRDGTGSDVTDSDGLVFDGTLADLEAAGSTELARILNSGDAVSFRFTFELADTNDALDRVAQADFVWEAVPG